MNRLAGLSAIAAAVLQPDLAETRLALTRLGVPFLHVEVEAEQPVLIGGAVGTDATVESRQPVAVSYASPRLISCAFHAHRIKPDRHRSFDRLNRRHASHQFHRIDYFIGTTFVSSGDGCRLLSATRSISGRPSTVQDVEHTLRIELTL
jgi:hypothetical protein